MVNPVRGMAQEGGGFVDDEKEIVLIKDGELAVGAGELRMAGIADEHGFSRSDAPGGLGRAAAQEDPALGDEALDLAARVAVQALRQIEVDAPPFLGLLDLEGDLDPAGL